MNVTFCHNHYQQRSGEDIAFDFAVRLLREDGHQVSVCDRSNSEISDFSVGDKLLFPARVLYSRETRKQVADVVRRQNTSVALVQNVFPLLSPSVYYGLSEARVPIVQLLFNYRLACLNGQFFSKGSICERCKNGNYLHGVWRRCYRNSHVLSAIYATSIGLHRWIGTWRKLVTLFVVPDLFLKNKLAETGVPADRIRVVTNPFDYTASNPDYSRGSYALFVGRLIRPKGIFTLLEASRELNEVALVIAGDGEEVSSVHAHAIAAGGQTTYVGPAYGDRLVELIRGAACVVVPSEWYDNLPMIVCQAFSMGRPVIASAINGIPEFVKHGENGLLFTPGNARELRDSIRSLCGDPVLHARLCRGARTFAETVLSPRAWQENMNSVFREALILSGAG